MLSKIVKTAEIPELPRSAVRVLQKLREPEPDFDGICDALSFDPALTVRLLKVANSSAYAPKSEIHDVRHAVSLLGQGALEQLVLSIAVRTGLPSPTSSFFNAQRFWKTAALRASIARSVATRLHPARAPEAFTAELLLDFGVPITLFGLGDSYGEVLDQWHTSGGTELVDLERMAGAPTHTRVGSLLADSWELPASITRAIAVHHDRSASDQDLMPALRLVAGIREVDGEAALANLVDEAKASYGLDPGWTQDAIASSEDAADELAKSLAA